MATTFRSAIEKFSPSWLLGKLSGPFVGVVYGLVGDAIAEAESNAMRMGYILDPQSPDDALPLFGSERRMPRYPTESMAKWRLRLWDAWTAYSFGGSAHAIESQLAAAGFPGAEVVYSGPGIVPGYWSQFWVFFPIGSHPVTGLGPAWGSFTWGDGTHWGPTGITPEQLTAIREIISKWKSSRWICRGITFELSGWTWGTGHTWGEPGLEWGGEHASVGA